MKRYIIIFGLTLIISLFLIFYNPNSKYLGIYNDSFTIEYDYEIEGYKWEYEIDNNIFDIDTINDNKWVFNAINDGECNVIFRYTNEEDNIYTIKYSFNIKNNKIYWTTGEALGLLDYPNPI